MTQDLEESEMYLWLILQPGMGSQKGRRHLLRVQCKLLLHWIRRLTEKMKGVLYLHVLGQHCITERPWVLRKRDPDWVPEPATSHQGEEGYISSSLHLSLYKTPPLSTR